MNQFLMDKNSFLIALVLMLHVFDVSAGSRKITFENKSGEVAHDLHIEFEQGVTAKEVGDTYGGFDNYNSSPGSSGADFDGGTIAKDAKVKIKFESTSPKIEVKKWYWTDADHKKIGSSLDEDDVAMVTFDQSRLALGELATVEVYAIAALEEDSNYQVEYALSAPDGSYSPMPPVQVFVMAGMDSHEQLWTMPLDQVGLYSIEYTAFNMGTGEEVGSGASSIMVDESVNPIQPPIR